MNTEAEKQLAALVAMQTLSDNIADNDAALDYLESYFAQRGLLCRRHRFDGHGALTASTRRGNTKRPAVLLAAHIDVMAGSDALFALRQDGDKLLGRGVYDMKCAVAGYMQLIDELKNRLADYDFGVMITSDEEYGGRNNISGTHKLVEQGYLPGVCIIPDSTAPGWNIEKGAKGTWRFDLIANGRSAHGSRPWEGESAAVKLIDALYELKTHFTNQGPETHSLNIGIINGGVTYNQIPERMQAAIELRLATQEAYQEFDQYLTELCTRHNLIFEERRRGSTLTHDLQHPYIQNYLDTVEQLTNKRPQPQLSCGLSDASYFTAKGVPCIVSCPQGGGHHSETEWISRASFAQFVPILHNYLEKTAKKPRVRTAVNNLSSSLAAA